MWACDLAARVDVRLETLTAGWIQQHSLALQDRKKASAGTLQVCRPHAELLAAH